MEVTNFMYNDQTIEFASNNNDSVMVNATQMAKIFDKRIDVFLKADHVKSFIEVLELTPFGGSLTTLKREEIVQIKNGVHTFFHRILALKFAAWLDPRFEVWVFSTIDTIILGHYREQKDATEAKLRAEKELENKKIELLKKYPEFAEFLELENKITDADRRRMKAIKASVAQLKFDLFNEEPALS